MKRIIDVDENLICEGFVRNFTEEERDVLINAIGNSIPYEKRPQGEWIFTNDDYGFWHCNQCKAIGSPNNNFCPNCGADMRGTRK